MTTVLIQSAGPSYEQQVRAYCFCNVDIDARLAHTSSPTIWSVQAQYAAQYVPNAEIPVEILPGVFSEFPQEVTSSISLGTHLWIAADIPSEISPRIPSETLPRKVQGSYSIAFWDSPQNLFLDFVPRLFQDSSRDQSQKKKLQKSQKELRRRNLKINIRNDLRKSFWRNFKRKNYKKRIPEKALWHGKSFKELLENFQNEL